MPHRLLVKSANVAQEKLINALEAIAPVSEEHRAALRAGLTGNVRQYHSGEEIGCEGDVPHMCAVIVDGFACRCQYLQTGERQILSIHIPGDMPDVQTLHLRGLDHSVFSLNQCTILHVEHATLRVMFERFPALGNLFWRGALIDASIFRKWITNVGQRQAESRIAHLLCELVSRLKAIGLSDGVTCNIPITQTDIADATGLSTVHTNRSLQNLRGHHFIQLRSGVLTILDWDGLAGAAGFNPAYLFLRA